MTSPPLPLLKKFDSEALKIAASRESGMADWELQLLRV
jgi:hypothetical protein